MKKPQVTLKLALTLDGKITAPGRRWITGKPARTLAHKLRSKHDAILVGVNTVLADDPMLTVRHTKGKHPIRIILDSRLTTPASSKIVRTAAQYKTIIFTCSTRLSKTQKLTKKGVTVIRTRASKEGQVDLRHVLGILYRKNIKSVLVEGGAKVAASFLSSGYVDNMSLFIASFTAPSGIKGITGRLELKNVTIKEIGKDILCEAKVLRYSR